MKKKKLSVFVFLLALCLLCACSAVGGNNSSAAPESVPQSAPESAPESLPADGPDGESRDSGQGAADEVLLRKLFDANLDCMLNIYELTNLPVAEEPVKDMIYPVADDRFKTFADLESYTRSVYVSETADELLYFEFDGHRRYFDLDGVLCEDLYLAAGKGYYVDWTDYKLVIETADDKECRFTVTAVLEEPAENPVPEPYELRVRAVFENGAWKLDRMYH